MSETRYYAGTGSRSLVLDTKRFNLVVATLESMMHSIKDKSIKFEIICGGAEGFDHALALAAQNAKIPYTLCIPSDTYAEYYWKNHSLLGVNRLEEFNHMANHAQDVVYVCDHHYNGKANLIRNEWMVDRCHKLWVYNSTSVGTSRCLDYAKKIKRPFYIIDKDLP